MRFMLKSCSRSPVSKKWKFQYFSLLQSKITKFSALLNTPQQEEEEKLKVMENYFLNRTLSCINNTVLSTKSAQLAENYIRWNIKLQVQFLQKYNQQTSIFCDAC